MILDGLKYGADLRREDRHAAELGVATLTSTLININRTSNSPPAKPQEYFFFAPKDSDKEISPEAANCFFALAKDGKLPAWALNHAPMDDLVKLKDTSLKPPKRRAMVGNGAIAFAPSVIGDHLMSSFVIWENPAETIELTDVDFGDTIVIESDLNPDFEGFEVSCQLNLLTLRGR